VKFLCEHCKAKYQIADEKVVGRTVRMKCRKCGGAIEVRAAVTETSVSMKAADLAGDGKAKPTAPRPPPPRATPLATSLSSSARTAGPASPLAGAFQRNVQREDEATSAGFDVRELSAADEWYVAVNGVPVGPVRVGEVRRKAAMGAVTEESLCWQEGMEEWRAIRTVTELAAVVREAASGGRSSQVPPEPRTSHLPGVRPAAPRNAGRDAAKAPSAPSAPAWASRASAAGMDAQRAPDPSEEDAAPTIVGRSPLLELEAAAAAGAMTNGAAASADPFRPPGVDPFRNAAPSPFKPIDPFAPQATAVGTGGFAAAAPPAPITSPFAAPQPIIVAAPRRFSVIEIGVIAGFVCFSLMAAYILLTPKPQAPIVVTVPAAPVAAVPPPTAAAAPTAAAVPGAPVTSAAPAVIDAGAVRVASAATPHAGGGGASTGSRPTNTTATDPGLRDLIAGTGNGPAAGPGGGGGGGGGAQLTEDEVKSVVTQHSLGVKRTCWDRSSTTTASVNIMVHVVVAGSGQVTQANATGNDPVVAHCLEDEIKRWHWPGGGEVNVPFHFLRQ
jgi:predicted Zn finger-like uncharacterized protein